MNCKFCGHQIDDDAKFCPSCGKRITKANELEDISKPSSGAEERKSGDKIKKRNFWKYLLLSIITFGIYGIYTWYGYVKDINKVCEGDGKKSPNYLIVLLLGICTLGIYPLFWWYRQATRLKDAAPKYGVTVRESGGKILLWLILGSFLFGVGPFVATYIMFDNLNRIALNFNGEKDIREMREMPLQHLKLGRNVAIIVVIELLILVAFIASIVSFLFGNSSIGGASNVMDAEQYIGLSGSELLELGFDDYDQDEMSLEDENGSINFFVDENNEIYMILLMDGADIPFHGVYIGDSIEVAMEQMEKEFELIAQRESDIIFENIDNPNEIVSMITDEENRIYSINVLLDSGSNLEYDTETEIWETETQTTETINYEEEGRNIVNSFEVASNDLSEYMGLTEAEIEKAGFHEYDGDGLYYNQERTMYGFDNDGDEKINVLYIEEDTSTSLYGVHIGDTIEQASDMLSDFCWVSYESYEEVDFQGYDPDKDVPISIYLGVEEERVQSIYYVATLKLSGWGGAFENKETGQKLIVGQMLGVYSYRLYSANGGVLYSESNLDKRDNPTEGEYISGQYCSIFKNDDETLSLVGVGIEDSFERISGTLHPDGLFGGIYGDGTTTITVMQYSDYEEYTGVQAASVEIETEDGMKISANLYVQEDGSLAICVDGSLGVIGIMTIQDGQAVIKGSDFDGTYPVLEVFRS